MIKGGMYEGRGQVLSCKFCVFVSRGQNDFRQKKHKGLQGL